MKEMIKAWKHIFKLDPDRELTDEALEAVCMSGSDAIMIGGSSGITYDNTVDLLSRVRRYELPCVQEISDLEAVVPGFDLYMVPMVLNAQDTRWITGQHQAAIEHFGYMIPWELIVCEGYIVLNPDSTVARLTSPNTALEAEGVAAYVQVADRLMNLPVVYIEYSGTFGDMETVESARNAAYQSQLFYGGGIVDYDTAAQAAKVADAIVVGNAVYYDLPSALATVQAVKPGETKPTSNRG
ncbi:heptaprenylglyceryl phosphate synthase [Paenibacillus sp. 453mf]|uniref:heptaprenylglyceryl phosphate synthase n=1 Tax=Paenibacillus sp. 453mf TaxID=1761874 RepID=UPI0008EB3D52|nr:heptaprenylglyceryl phosphate synthase [Paenibacillus sp. 453mf]SFS84397.1 putative glycerol-1-phosphate prenyltransferase [Paenibacillus sp. 453mf]